LANLDKSQQLLRHLYRTRTSRKRFLDRIPVTFHWGRHRKAVEREILADWPGGYVLINDRDYFYVPSGQDMMSSHYLIRPAESEPAIRNLCPEGGVAIDVGANFGEWSLQMARAVGATGRVFAFEPSPAIAEALRKTLAINGQKHASVIEAAASATEGAANFTVNEDHSGKSGIGTEAGGDRTRDTSVPTVTLDSFAASQQLDRLDFIKIDVEGHDAEVLAGADKTLGQFKPALVLEAGIEPDHDRSNVKAILERHSYAPAGAFLPHGIIETTWEDYLNKTGLFSDGFVNVLFLAS